MSILNIPITKAGGRTVAIDDKEIPDAMYAMALAEGLKVMLNKGMAKVKSLKGLDEKETAIEVAAAMEVAAKNMEKIKTSSMTKGRTAAKTADGAKIPAKVLTAARNLAKEIIKDEVRASGMRPSMIPAKQYTEYANAFLDKEATAVANGDMDEASTCIGRAKAIIAANEARTTKPVDDTMEAKLAAKAKADAFLSQFGEVKEDPTKAAKADGAKKPRAKKGETLSKTQAGMIKAAPRKPQAQATAH